jgi:acetyltransferase-like isoleucine patch superfamily enzyme
MSILVKLYQWLKELHAERHSAVHAEWRRSLPFCELLADRWERARILGFGEGSSIYQNSYVFGDVAVGKHTWIGPYTMLDGSGSLRIGDCCSISTGVQIYTHDSVAWALTGGKASYEQSPVSIGNCCYIGSQTVISKGVSIGDHSIIGACSFVNRSMPPYSLAFGTPCRVRGRVEVTRDQRVILHLDKSRQGEAA